MDNKALQEYKDKLLHEKQEILNGGILTSQEDLTVSSDDLPDEADLATSVINQQVTFEMRQRQMTKLRSIEEALMRIEDGTFGFCEECEEPIGQKRLSNQPWSTLCIEHAEELERENARFKRAG